jgi:DNA-binding transcriptional ArsR family regulator
VEQEYGGQKRESKGLLRNYLGKMTGLSRAQVTRLIGRYLKNGIVKERRYRRNRFAIQYHLDYARCLTRSRPAEA